MNEVDAIKAVQNMQEYIENNLFNNITLKQLSNAAGYSPWHAARLFKEVTKKTPFDYIRALRLSKAALILRDKDEKVLSESAPRFQLAPMGYRGYIEARPVEKVN